MKKDAEKAPFLVIETPTATIRDASQQMHLGNIVGNRFGIISLLQGKDALIGAIKLVPKIV